MERTYSLRELTIKHKKQLYVDDGRVYLSNHGIRQAGYYMEWEEIKEDQYLLVKIEKR